MLEGKAINTNFIPPSFCHSNCVTCQDPSNSHHQTVTQSILPAVLLCPVPFLKFSLSLFSLRFDRNTSYSPALCEQERHSGFHPFSCLLYSCHKNLYWILPHWSHPSFSSVWHLPLSYTLPGTVKDIPLSSVPTSQPSGLALPSCLSIFTCFYKLFAMLLLFIFNLPFLFVFPLYIQCIRQ